MIEQKIIFGCNHIISTLKKSSMLFNITRDSGESDTITRIGIITDVYYVYQVNDGSDVTKTYKAGIDYTVNKNEIAWTSGGSHPATGEVYQIEAWINQRITSDYSENPQLCERCYGQGWYVDMMGSGYKRVEKAGGINKLVQDYIKILYTKTQDDGYGTELLNLSGTSVYDENDFLASIATELSSAALQLEKIQAAILAENNTALTDEETLAGIEVKSMEFDRSDSSAYVVIVLTSLAQNSSATMNFKF